MHVLKKGFSRHNRISVSNDGKSTFYIIQLDINYHIRYHINDVYKQFYWHLICKIFTLSILFLVLSDDSLLIMAMCLAFNRKGTQINFSNFDICYN